MARASLLNSYEPGFEFEHAMSHRNALGVMSPLNRFSVIPYFIDPFVVTDPPSGPWNKNHARAHIDASIALPSEIGSTSRGIAISANLIDYDFSNPDSREWWTFVNHIEHYVGGATVLPQSTPQPPPPAPQWRYPFW